MEDIWPALGGADGSEAVKCVVCIPETGPAGAGIILKPCPMEGVGTETIEINESDLCQRESESQREGRGYPYPRCHSDKGSAKEGYRKRHCEAAGRRNCP